MKATASRSSGRFTATGAGAIFACVSALIPMAGGSAAFGQSSVLYDVAGAADERLGRSVAGAGELNDDGHDDFIIGVPGATVGMGFLVGRVEVRSGIDGEILHSFEGTTGGGAFGTSVASVGDLDDDGVPDIVVGAPSFLGASAPPGYVKVFSGADGSEVRTLSDGVPFTLFGSSVAGVGDINGDGKAEFLVGAPGGNGIAAGSARLYSGADDTVLLTVNGTGTSNLGHAVAGLGDVDGDGTPDFAIAAPGFTSGRKQRVGQVTIYSGATLAPLKVLTGKKSALNFGWSVAGAGDVNGDGFADVIVGAIGAAPNKKTAAGQVTLYSGRNFKKLGSIKGNASSSFVGSAVAGVGDVNGDGLDDIAVGASGVNGFGGLVAVFVRSGGKLSAFFAFTGAPGEDFGDAIANAGDVDGNGAPDLILGGWGAGPVGMPGAGVAKVFSY